MTSLGRLYLSLGGAFNSVIEVFDSDEGLPKEKGRKRCHSVIEVDSEDEVDVAISTRTDVVIFTQTDLGLPKSGIPRICNTKKHIYRGGPFGRQIEASNAYGDKSGRLEPFLWARIQNRSMSLSGKQAGVLYGEFARMFGITFNERKSESEHGAKNTEELEFVLPKAMGGRIAPVLSDSGQKAQRGLSLAHLTFAAALYLVGWLDDEFKLIKDLISFSIEEQPQPASIERRPFYSLSRLLSSPSLVWACTWRV